MLASSSLPSEGSDTAQRYEAQNMPVACDVGMSEASLVKLCSTADSTQVCLGMSTERKV